jgi:hypothetical protein
MMSANRQVYKWLNNYNLTAVSQFIRSFAEKLGGMCSVHISSIC